MRFEAAVAEGGDLQAGLEAWLPLDEERLTDWRVIIAFWGVAVSDPELAEVQNGHVTRARARVEKLLRQDHQLPEKSSDLRAARATGRRAHLGSPSRRFSNRAGQTREPSGRFLPIGLFRLSAGRGLARVPQKNFTYLPRQTRFMSVLDFGSTRRVGSPRTHSWLHRSSKRCGLGWLQPGDKLPTAHQVASSVAINPNTVQKAYKELEYEGLVIGKAGQGTFVQRSLSQSTPSSLAALSRRLERWLAAARAAGLDEDGIMDVIEATMRDFDRQASA